MKEKRTLILESVTDRYKNIYIHCSVRLLSELYLRCIKSAFMIHSSVVFFLILLIFSTLIKGSEWNVIAKIDYKAQDFLKYYQSEPFDYTLPKDIYAASELLSMVESYAGAFYWSRDSVDSIAVYDLLNETGYWLEDITD